MYSPWSRVAWRRYLELIQGCSEEGQEGEWQIIHKDGKLIFLHIYSGREIRPELSAEQIRKVLWGSVPLLDLDFIRPILAT